MSCSILNIFETGFLCRGNLLSQEILEHILQFTDGETLLMCQNVSPEFAAAVKYLTKTTKIWKKCYLKEKEERYPYSVISKLYPHSEGFRQPKNWGLIYEITFFDYFDLFKCSASSFNEVKLGKDYSDILDVQTHGDLILVLLKYSRDFSKYCRIFTINLDNFIVDKSSIFYADKLYVTPIEKMTSDRRDAILLSCDLCHLVAVPLSNDEMIEGYPKLYKTMNFLKIEHMNGDILWINNLRGLLTKENCFSASDELSHKEIKIRDSKTVKVFQGFTTLFVSCGDTQKEFNTFKDLKATVSASLCYSHFLILGTNTGMLYVYKLANESDLKLLDLKSHIWHFDVCSNSILRLNVMELQHQLIFICCSEKSMYKIHFNRSLKNYD